MKTIGLDISPLNDKQKTGIGVYTFELIKALLKINQQDRFVLFGISTLETRNYLQNIEYKKYPNVRLAIYTMPSKAFRTAFLLWQKINFPPIEKLLGPIDLFHNFNWYFTPQKKGKRVATVFDMTPILYPQWHRGKTVQLDKLRLQRIKKYADLVVTISQNSKEDFSQFAPEAKVEVVYPAPSARFKPALSPNLKPGYILSVATLEPRKNLVTAIKAFLESGLPHKLVLAGGTGWGAEEIFNFAKKYPHKIEVSGFVRDDDLLGLYQGAVCLIYPSFYEGFGMPVLEALASGVPVICSNTSSLPEAGGDAAVYIDPENKNSLKKALIEVVGNASLRKKMIDKGLKQAQKFSWERSARKLNQLYQQLLQR